MQKSNFRIRKARLSDLPKILEIEHNNFLDPWNTIVFISFIERKAVSFIVAETKNDISGYIILIVERKINFKKLKNIKHGHVLNLAINWRFKRKGVGSMLLNFILQKFKKKVSKIYLEVRKSNIAALNLYLKFGFKIERIMKAYYLDNEDAYQLSKDFLPSTYKN